MSIPLLISYAALWIVVIVQAAILVGVMRSLYEVRQRDRAADLSLVKGQPVPEFATVDLSGRPVSTATFTGEAAVLLFVSPNCQNCMVALAELQALASDPARRLFIFCYAAPDDCQRLAADYEITVPVIADEDGRLKRMFGVTSTPMAVRVDADGFIQSYGSPVRGEEFEHLAAGHAAHDESTVRHSDERKVAVR
jgi:peroxiredoxin